METQELIDRVIGSWRINNHINLSLLQHISRKSFSAMPNSSRGQTVAQQFAHLHHVRNRWLEFNSPDLVAGVPRFQRVASPNRKTLKAAHRASGKAVEAFLRTTLANDGSIKYFSQSPVRWMAYLISHESHHRGQIALALKQSGMKLPEKVAFDGLGRTWYWKTSK